MLEQVEAGQRAQDLKMDILQAIRYIIQAWGEVGGETVANCWRHTTILPVNINANLRNLSDNVCREAEPEPDNLSRDLQALCLSDPMQVDEFLNIPEENIVNEILPMDQMIEELIDVFKATPDEATDNPEEADDSVEVPVIKARTALESMETMRMFLLQQEDAADHIKSIVGIEKYIQEKLVKSMQQTTIDQFFSL